MCGIVAYVGGRACLPILIEGLERLEYRGYDSVGVAVHSGAHLHVRRSVGDLQSLRDELAQAELPGSTGIGHTRWATHGAPALDNAHPHRAGRIALVHNGIIENHAELRAVIEARGRRTSGQTDSEVLANLIDLAVQDGTPLAQAVRASLRQVAGSFAIAVVDDMCPGYVVLARRGSPLVVGIGDGEVYASSDAPSLSAFDCRVMYLNDGDLVEAVAGGVTVTDAEGATVEREVRTLAMAPDATDKCGFAHYMLKEINEQPRALRDTVAQFESLDMLAEVCRNAGLERAYLQGVSSITVVGCGTSHHAGLLARGSLEELTGIPTSVEIASEFRSRRTATGPNTLVIGVSQSGETVDTLAAVERAKAQGARTLAVTNVIDSALSRLADGALYTKAGPEIGVASTKCFVTQVAALFAVSLHIGRSRGLAEGRAAHLLEELRRIPFVLQSALEMALLTVPEQAGKALNASAMFLIGRGPSYPVSLEGALKIKEIAYLHAEGFAAGELKHGPLALIEPGTPVIVVAPNDEHRAKTLSNAQEVAARGARLILVTDRPTDELPEGTEVVPIPSTASQLSCLVSCIPLQVLAYELAVQQGLNVDRPRNLAKTVTVE